MSAPSLPQASSTSLAGQRRISTGRLVRGALVATVAALLANALLRLLARGPLEVPGTFEPLTWGMLVGSTLVGVLGAALVLAVLVRQTRQPLRWFWIVGAGVLVLSLGGPLSMRNEPGGSTTAVLILVAMHVVTAMIAVGVLTAVAQADAQGRPFNRGASKAGTPPAHRAS